MAYVSQRHIAGPQTELTCCSMFIFDSNHAPKFLAQFEGKMVAPPTFIDRSEGILLTSLDEKSITSVLSVLSFNIFLCIHDTISLRQPSARRRASLSHTTINGTLILALFETYLELYQAILWNCSG